MMDDDYVFKSLSTDDKNDMYFQKGLTFMTSSNHGVIKLYPCSVILDFFSRWEFYHTRNLGH